LDHGYPNLARSAAQTTAQQRTVSLGPVERADLKKAVDFANPCRSVPTSPGA